jgi:threonine dehydratase
VTREPIAVEDVRAAADRIRGAAIRTPLVRLNVDDAPAEIWLKLECLQPIGSFKIRGSANVMARPDRERLARGVYTASAGNMAQGVAWNARRLGVPAWAVVPDTAPEAKLAAIARLGATAVPVTFDQWWDVITAGSYEPLADRTFVHPFLDADVMAGNGTIALEILEDLPEVSAVVVPYGGGGLSCGIASTFRVLRPSTTVFASEVETGAPFAASLAAGRPTTIDYAPSFVDGIGGKAVVPEMFELARTLLAGSLVVSLDETAAALRLLVERNHVVAEGAGATAVAAALSGRAGSGTVVCVISGGNIDPSKVATILSGAVP